MSKEEIRNSIRIVLKEVMQQFHPAYYVNSSANRFPYKKDDEIVRLPEDINTSHDYFINWKRHSENNDLYNFPIEEFKKGISVEKAKKTNFNTIEIAEKVIDNLKENPRFYSNLGA